MGPTIWAMGLNSVKFLQFMRFMKQKVESESDQLGNSALLWFFPASSNKRHVFRPLL